MNHKNSAVASVFLVITIMALTSCKKNEDVSCDLSVCILTQQFIFASGFEPGTIGEPQDAILQFDGVDTSCGENNWSTLNKTPYIGDFNIQHQSGTYRQRWRARWARNQDMK